MLDRLQDYFIPAFQLPLALVFLVGWLIGGAYLLRKGAQKNTERQLRTISMGRCVGIMLVSGVLGSLAGMMVLGIGVLLYQVVESKPFVMLFALLAGMMMLGMGFLSINMQIKLPVKRAWSIAWKPLFATVGLMVLVGIAALVPARSMVMRGAARNEAMMNLGAIKQGMKQYVNIFGYPDTLDNLLVIGDWMKESTLRNKIRPDLEVAYFYYPPDIELAKTDPNNAMLAVSYVAHEGDGRVVMSFNKRITWLTDDEFTALLAMPINAAFAEKLAEAEAELATTSGHLAPPARRQALPLPVQPEPELPLDMPAASGE